MIRVKFRGALVRPFVKKQACVVGATLIAQSAAMSWTTVASTTPKPPAVHETAIVKATPVKAAPDKAAAIPATVANQPITDLVAGVTRLWDWLQSKRQSQLSAKRLRVRETVSLGDKRFVALIEADGRHFLIGGASNQVSMLANLNDEQGFSEVLHRELCTNSSTSGR